MATKYHRNTDVHEEIEGRRTPWIRQGPPRRRLSPRQRIAFILLGLAILGVLGRIAYQLNIEGPFVYQPVLRGEGTVISREADSTGTGSGRITVEIDIGGPVMMLADWRMPAPYWEGLAIGDRVAVHYRLGKRKLSIDLVECGMVALPDQNP